MNSYSLNFPKLIIKKINSFFLILYFYFKEDKIIKKFKKISDIKEIEKFKDKKNYNHPAVVFFRSFLNLQLGNVKKCYQEIENYEKIKNLQNPNKDVNYFLKNQIVPSFTIHGSFGNYRTLFSYLYNRINIQKIGIKPKIFIKKYDKITNQFLFNFFKPFLNFKRNSFLYYKNFNNSYYYKTPIEFSLPYKNKYYPWAVSENLINQHRLEYKKTKFDFFTLSKKHLDMGRNILKRFNLSKYKWHVAIHMRESKGLDDQSYRDVNPSNYLKGIHEIISRGGLVFRVGDKNVTPLPKIEGLIDYPFSEFKSEFMDIFLASTSKFVIGTSSGFWTAASFFNTPLLMTNYLPFLDYYAFNQQSIFLPKTVVNENKNIISLYDSYSLSKFGFAVTSSQFKIKKKMVLENSEDEILKGVKEMFSLLSKKSIEKNKFINLNKSFKNNFFKEKYFDNNKLIPLANFSSSYINKYL